MFELSSTNSTSYSL